MSAIAMPAHPGLDLPEGVEGPLDAETVYDPPNLTFPFGAYICVTDVDPGTGEVVVRRFIAVDDCGVRINPMIVEGQIHGGVAPWVSMALKQAIAPYSRSHYPRRPLIGQLLSTAGDSAAPEPCAER